MQPEMLMKFELFYLIEKIKYQNGRLFGVVYILDVREREKVPSGRKIFEKIYQMNYLVPRELQKSV